MERSDGTCTQNISVQVNVLVVGGGGREHALAWKLGQSPACASLFCAPGNPGIAIEPNVTTLPDLSISDHSEVVSFCKSNGVGLVVVGPEAPLVEGLVDSLADAGLPSIGPTQAAAQLEGSKSFMKDLCRKYGIPTAESAAFESTEAAHAYIAERGAPIVVKASGLAAGKGVILAETVEDAQQAATEMLEGGKFGSAGKQIVIEEFLQGEEASYFALIDGSSVVPLGSAQDHKAVFDGDKGPNTGGMGAYSPAPVVTPELEAQVCSHIIAVQLFSQYSAVDISRAFVDCPVGGSLLWLPFQLQERLLGEGIVGCSCRAVCAPEVRPIPMGAGGILLQQPPK